VRRNKSDQVDAAAIYEAMSRPGQRFMPVRSIANQAELMHHRAREFLAGQRTAALNALRWSPSGPSAMTIFARRSGRDLLRKQPAALVTKGRQNGRVRAIGKTTYSKLDMHIRA
jgi:transposase